MIGILTEKPSAAKNFAKALGQGKAAYKGEFEGEQYRIAASRGHLYGWRDPIDQVPSQLKSKYRQWSMDTLPWNHRDFQWKRFPLPDTQKVIQEIRQSLSGCDEIAIATDMDPTGEGQLLAWEILQETGLWKNRRITRIEFADESEKEIQKAFRNRKPNPPAVQDSEFLKADFRTKFDFLSMQLTRAATSCTINNALLRQGRLKSAMVSLVGEAIEKEAAYEKIAYFQNRFRDDNGNVFVNPEEEKFGMEFHVPAIYKPSTVKVLETEKRKTPPPLLPDLAELSSILSKRGIKSKDVLEVYQAMYTDSYVSYPRTEDKFITMEQYEQLKEQLPQLAKMQGVRLELLPLRSPRKIHVKDKAVHGANRPGSKVPDSMDEFEKYASLAKGKGRKIAEQIYSLLSIRSLLLFAEDYRYYKRRACIEGYEAFEATIQVPLEGQFSWKNLYQPEPEKKKKGEEETEDPAAGVQISRGFAQKAKPFIYKGYPAKPPHPTMTWLMKQLKKYDVGTGATRTSIYADVTSEAHQYPLLRDTNGRIEMTDYGRMSFELLRGSNIASVAMTEEMMADMRNIAEGKDSTDHCLEKMEAYVRQDIDTMLENQKRIVRENIVDGFREAPVQSIQGIWNGRPVIFRGVYAGHVFTKEEADRLFAGEKIFLSDLTGKSGEKYGAYLYIGTETFQNHDITKIMVEYGQNQSKRPPRSFCSHLFTDREKEELMQGKKVHLNDCVSKKTGNRFSCHVTWNAEDGIVPDFAKKPF